MSDQNDVKKNHDILKAVTESGMPEFYIYVLDASTKSINDSIPKDARLPKDESMKLVDLFHYDEGERLEVKCWGVESRSLDLLTLGAYPAGSTWHGTEAMEWHIGPGGREPTDPMRANYADWRKSICGDAESEVISLCEELQRNFLIATIQNAVEYGLMWEPEGDLTVFARGLPLCNEMDIVLTIHPGAVADKRERRSVNTALH